MLCAVYLTTLVYSPWHRAKGKQCKGGQPPSSCAHHLPGDTHRQAGAKSVTPSADKIATVLLREENRVNLLCCDSHFKLLDFICLRNHRNVFALFSSASPKSGQCPSLRIIKEHIVCPSTHCFADKKQ